MKTDAWYSKWGNQAGNRRQLCTTCVQLTDTFKREEPVYGMQHSHCWMSSQWYDFQTRCILPWIKRDAYVRPNYTHRDVPLSALLLFALISYWHTDAKRGALVTICFRALLIDFWWSWNIVWREWRWQLRKRTQRSDSVSSLLLIILYYCSIYAYTIIHLL